MASKNENIEPQLWELFTFLRTRYPRDVLMPTARHRKSPLFPHKHGLWGWTDFLEFCDEKRDRLYMYDYCILLHDLCVIDVDGSAEEVREFEYALQGHLVTEDAKVAVSQTSRGRHYWFERSKLADEFGYYDGAAQRRKGVDFKSRCSTGERGTLMVPPSSGKAWIISPVELGCKPIPDSLLDQIALPRFSVSTSARMTVSFYPCPSPSPLTPACMTHRPLLEDASTAREIVGGVRCSPHVQRMAYFEPFFSFDKDDLVFEADHVIPIPCRRHDFFTLVTVLETGYFLNHDDVDFQELRAVLNASQKLGVTKSDEQKLLVSACQGDLYFQVSLCALCPRWWRAFRSEKRTETARRRGRIEVRVSSDRFDSAEEDEEGAAALMNVDADLASKLTFEPLVLSAAQFQHERLFPRCRVRPFHLTAGDRVIVDSPETAILSGCPSEVLDLLRAFPRKLTLAGGALLRLLCPRTDVTNGNGGVHRQDGAPNGNSYFSDFDLFLTGAESEQEASDILTRVDQILRSKLRDEDELNIMISGCATTFVCVMHGKRSETKHQTVIQVISCLYPSAVALLHAFDFGPCKSACWVDEFGKVRIVCTPLFVESMRTMAFFVDASKWSTSSFARTLKYMTKGFEAYVPGMRPYEMRDKCKARCLNIFRYSQKHFGGGGIGDLIMAEAMYENQAIFFETGNRSLTARWPNMRDICLLVRDHMMSDYSSRVSVSKSIIFIVLDLIRRGSRRAWTALTGRGGVEENDRKKQRRAFTDVPWVKYDPDRPVMRPADPKWRDVLV